MGKIDQQFFLSTIRVLTKEIYSKMLSNLVKIYEPYDLTPSQVSVLLKLSDCQREKVSELGNKLNTADSNISAICSRLEKRKLIFRERDENDQRIVYIKLTPQARCLMEKIEAEKYERLIDVRNINEEDMNIIIKALEKLNELLDYSKILLKE